MASIKSGLAALRDFDPANDRFGQKRPWCHVGSNVWFARKETSIGGPPRCYPGDCRHSPNGLYGTLGREWTCYSLIFAARMTLPHFSFSAAMNFPNSAGEVAKTVSPQSTIVCLILGSARPALIALLSTSMLAAGVSFGAVTPNQPTAS